MSGNQSWMGFIAKLDRTPELKRKLSEAFALLVSLAGRSTTNWAEQAEALLQTLLDWSAPDEMLVAGVLTRLFWRLGLQEETPSWQEGLMQQFGFEHVQLAIKTYTLSAQGMDEPGVKESVRFKVPHAARLAQLYRAAYRDYRVALLCLAEPMALIGGLPGLDRARQKCWADLTNDIFIPLAEMCGMWEVRHQLATTSLTWLATPKQITGLQITIEDYKERHAKVFQRLAPVIRSLLAPLRFDAQVTLHTPTIAGLFRRKQKSKQLGAGMRVGWDGTMLLVDVVIQEAFKPYGNNAGELACYLALGALHRLTETLGGVDTEAPRIRDHIARPQVNGYAALITTLAWREGGATSDEAPQRQVVQFRVRTAAMETVNTNGVITLFSAHSNAGPALKSAAGFVNSTHPARSSAAGRSNGSASDGPWWANHSIQELIGAQGPTDRTPTVYVFRPNGDIFLLPYGSTALDYAFKIRTSLGVFAQSFRVDGAIVYRGYQLYNSALVEVEFGRSYAAVEPEWTEQVVSSSAKQAIRSWLRQRDTPPEKGRKLIDQALTRELEAHRLRLPPSEIERELERIAIQRGYRDVWRLYTEAQGPQYTPDQVAMSVIEAQYVRRIARVDNQPWSPENIHIARCCLNSVLWKRKRPAEAHITPDAPIVGFEDDSGPHRRLAVHHLACPLAPKDTERQVALKWVGYAGSRQATQVTIITQDRSQLLGDILQHVYAAYSRGIYLHSLSANVLDDAMVEIEFVVDAPEIADLAPLQTELEQMKRSGDLHSVEFWRYFPGQQVLLTSYSPLTRPNPYSLLPLRNHEHDQKMFFGREDELGELLATIKDGTRLLVISGQSGIGKSSLLFHLHQAVLTTLPDVLPVLFDVSKPPQLRSINALLLGLANAALKQAQTTAMTWGQPLHARPLTAKQLESEPLFAFQQWVNSFIGDKLAGRRILFLVDEFTQLDDAWRRGEVERDLFHQLKWLINSLNDAQFALVTHDTLSRTPEYGVEPNSVATLMRQAQYFRMTPLSKEAARNLIRQPLRDVYVYDDEVVETIVRLTAGYPLFLQLICLEITTNLARANRRRVALDDLAVVVEKITRGEAAEGYLWRLLDELRASSAHRLVLTAIAIAAEHAEADRLTATVSDQSVGFVRYVDHWVSLAAITAIAQAADIRREDRILSAREVGEKLDELVLNGLVERRQVGVESDITFRIPIGLYTEWLLDQSPAPRLLQPLGLSYRPHM